MHLQAIVSTIHAKMEALPETEQSAAAYRSAMTFDAAATVGDGNTVKDEDAAGNDEAKEPERKRLKKIDFRYTLCVLLLEACLENSH